MITLADRQEAFLRAILDDRAPLPEGWSNRQAAGMDVYRGNYRSALMGALVETFERTRGYVGEEPFRQVAMHHAISHPPKGWTIDDAGAGFDETCAQLFGQNPEVAELAWLEWTMLEVATAPDCDAMTPQDFGEASAQFGDEEWGNLELEMAPRAAARLVAHDLDSLWRSMAQDEAPPAAPKLNERMTCIVWREEERPTFILLEPDHAEAFAAVQNGASYGEIIGLLIGEGDPTPDAIQAAAMRAGAILGRWLSEGLVTGIRQQS